MSSSSSASTASRSTTHVTGVAVASGVPRVTAALREMTERYFGFDALVLEPGVRTGMPILYDEPQGGRRRPHRQRGRRVRPLRRPDDRRRLRHRDHRRRGQREGRVPRRRDLPRHRDLAGRAVRRGRRAAARRARRAEERDRQDDGRGDPVGRGLRLQRPGRRARATASRRAGGVHGGRHRRPRRADHAALADRSSTTSPGSPSTGCASSTNGTSGH